MSVPFRRVALLENPVSGMLSSRRKHAVLTALDALREAGVAVEHFLIEGPGSGAALARKAIADGCDAVLVCGGDGTIHQVMQPLVGSGVALGVLPMGTANALAANLGLGRSPETALPALLTASVQHVPVGRIVFHDAQGAEHTRYFTVAAGIGADALLMARMDPRLKRRLGYILYLVEAFRIWVGHSFPLFHANVSDGGQLRSLDASQLLAVRVRSFGGVLGNFAPGASIYSPKLSMIAFRTRNRFRYLPFLLSVVVQRHTFRDGVELIEGDSVDCIAHNPAGAIYVEADGEVLGQLPARLEMAAEKLTLLIPANAHP